MRSNTFQRLQFHQANTQFIKQTNRKKIDKHLDMFSGSKTDGLTDSQTGRQNQAIQAHTNTQSIFLGAR